MPGKDQYNEVLIVIIAGIILFLIITGLVLFIMLFLSKEAIST